RPVFTLKGGRAGLHSRVFSAPFQASRSALQGEVLRLPVPLARMDGRGDVRTLLLAGLALSMSARVAAPAAAPTPTAAPPATQVPTHGGGRVGPLLHEARFDTGELTLNYAEGPPNGPAFVHLQPGAARWQYSLE